MHKSLAIVGSSGPLGRFLNDYFLLQGWSVRRIGRSQEYDVIVADVKRRPAPDVYGDTRAVIYCAWNTRQRVEPEQRAHVAAATQWSKLARDTDRTFLFTSTVGASKESASTYGRHKLMAEDAVRQNAGIALRIGLVADDGYPFLATGIRRVVRRLPSIAPALDLPVFAVSTTTLASSIAAEIEQPRSGQTVWLAPTEPTPLAAVARWGWLRSTPTRPILRWVSTGSTVLTRAQLRGHYLDALAALRDSHFRGYSEVVPPQTGRIDDDDWQRCLTER